MSAQNLSIYSRVQRFLASNKGFTFQYLLGTGHELTIAPYLKNNEVLFNVHGDCLLYKSKTLDESFFSVLMVAVGNWEKKNAIADYTEPKDIWEDSLEPLVKPDPELLKPNPEFIDVIRERLQDYSGKSVCVTNPALKGTGLA